MAKFRPVYLLRSQLRTYPISPGQYIVTTDNPGIYFDNTDGKRVDVSDVRRITESERTNTLAPVNHLYYITDTDTLWSYNGGWKKLIKDKASEILMSNGVSVESELNTIKSGLSSKVDQVAGKSLSTNDYTTTEKNKLAGIETGAEVNAVKSVAGKTGAVTLSKEDVGLGNVPNVITNDQTPTYTHSTALSALTSGEKLSAAFGKICKAVADLIAHLANKSNPHTVTKAQVGLGNVDNTSDENKPVSIYVAQALKDKAAIKHDSADSTYGLGNSTNYGHLKLTDSYSSTSSTGSGIATTPYALYYGLATKAPTSHTSTTTTYGAGSASYYGHVRMAGNGTASDRVLVVKPEQSVTTLNTTALLYPGVYPISFTSTATGVPYGLSAGVTYYGTLTTESYVPTSYSTTYGVKQKISIPKLQKTWVRYCYYNSSNYGGWVETDLSKTIETYPFSDTNVSFNDMNQPGCYMVRSSVDGSPVANSAYWAVWTGKSDDDDSYFEQLAIHESDGSAYIRSASTNGYTWNKVAYVANFTASVSTNWTANTGYYSQTVSVSGLKSSDEPIVDVVLTSDAAAAKLQLEAFQLVNRIVTSVNSMTLYCYGSKPTVAFTIHMKAVR